MGLLELPETIWDLTPKDYIHLRDLLTIGTAIINTAIELFLTEPTTCRSFLTKLRDIGKARDANPRGPVQNWYICVLVPVSRFSRAVKWYQAGGDPEHLLGNNDQESWAFCLSKSSQWYYKDDEDNVSG
jgi:hypothetical protein